ncbi:MAG: hypothetical protein LBN05_04025 [Oscillospiraceae bacterium]|jgi:hypothetical protein|nr:hypothetical protein [Oscillospiraceae bacterium]
MKRPAKQLALCALCLLAAGLMLARPNLAVVAMREGLLLCANRLIPALLPFLALATFVLRSGAADSLGRALAPLTRRVFRLPNICAPVILMALVGGYPVGLNLTAQLVRGGQITRADARRMSRFCVSAGPAFVVMGIGAGLLGSNRAGWILFAAVTVSALFLGLFVPCVGARHEVPCGYDVPLPPPQPLLLSRAFTQSAESAARQMLHICVWTLLFGLVSAYLPLFVHGENALHAARAVLEVTAGTASLAALRSLPLLAAALAWGGLCVHAQVLEPLRDCGQTLPRFWGGRLAHATLAAIVCQGLLWIFPTPLPDLLTAVSVLPAAKLWQFSAPAAVGLAAMGVGLLMDIRGVRSTNNCPL